MKCKLGFSCQYGSFERGQDVEDQRVLSAYPAYFEAVELKLETKPAPIKLETKPAPKKRRTKKAE